MNRDCKVLSISCEVQHDGKTYIYSYYTNPDISTTVVEVTDTGEIQVAPEIAEKVERMALDFLRSYF